MLLSDPRHDEMIQGLTPGKQDPARPCQLCGRPSEGGACPRCQASFCMEHLPTPGRRCHGCESHYIRRLRRMRSWLWLPLATIPWGLFVGTVILEMGSSSAGKVHFAPLVDVLIFVAGTGAIWFGTLIGAVGTWRRRRFLRERAKLSPSPTGP
jgi:hypothetical protein